VERKHDDFERGGKGEVSAVVGRSLKLTWGAWRKEKKENADKEDEKNREQYTE